MNAPAAVVKQHLIDPEICIRCNTCESICPVGAISHDSRNYVVDIDKCNWCNDCISPCPTGSIDNWRTLPRVMAYSPEVQLTWDDAFRATGRAGVPIDQRWADSYFGDFLWANLQVEQLYLVSPEGKLLRAWNQGLPAKGDEFAALAPKVRVNMITPSVMPKMSTGLGSTKGSADCART